MVYTCELCEGNYESLRGQCIHQSSCKKRFIRNDNVIATSLTDGCENISNAQIETANILLADEFFYRVNPRSCTKLTQLS